MSGPLPKKLKSVKILKTFPYVTTDLLHTFKGPFRSTSVYRGVLMLVNGVRSLVF